MEEVAGDAAVDGAAPCRLGTERRQHREIESRRKCGDSVQPLWWRRLGRSFIRGNGDDDALPVVQVKTAVWDGGGTKDEGNVGAAPWRWRMGRLIRRDDEIDDGSSSGMVDEGRRGVAVDDVVGEEAPAGWRTEQGSGFCRGFSRPRCTNGWADGMAVGNHGLETRLSEMWESYKLIPLFKFLLHHSNISRLGIGW